MKGKIRAIEVTGVCALLQVFNKTLVPHGQTLSCLSLP